MGVRILPLLLVLLLLVGPLAAGIASSETKVGSNVDVRTIVALKIADGEAQKLLDQLLTKHPALKAECAWIQRELKYFRKNTSKLI